MKNIFSYKYFHTLLIIILIGCGNITSQTLHLKKEWETDTLFKRPESIVYDSLRNRLDVSNYNKNRRNIELCNDYISILDLNGNLIELKWIEGLRAPTGLYIHADFLYIVERDGISKYSISDKEIAWKQIIPNAAFLNDLVIDEKGCIYYTDTSPKQPKESIIGMICNEKADTLIDEQIIRANGLFLHDKNLIVGNSGDRCLKSIDKESFKINNIAELDTGVIDGIKPFKSNKYLVSLNEGRLFLISPNNKVEELLDLRNQKINIADFEYIDKLKLIVIPTYNSNKVIAYKIVEIK